MTKSSGSLVKSRTGGLWGRQGSMHTHTHCNLSSVTFKWRTYSACPSTVVEITIQSVKSEEEEADSHSTFKITATGLCTFV